MQTNVIHNLFRKFRQYFFCNVLFVVSDFKTLQEVDLSKMNISYACLDSDLNSLIPSILFFIFNLKKKNFFFIFLF